MPLLMRLLDPEAVVKKIQERLRVLNTDRKTMTLFEQQSETHSVRGW